MTLSVAKKRILAAIQIDEGNDAQYYPLSRQVYKECIKQISKDSDGVDLTRWFNAMNLPKQVN